MIDPEEEAKSDASSDYVYEDVPNFSTSRIMQPVNLRKSYSVENWYQKNFQKLTKDKKDRVVIVDSQAEPSPFVGAGANKQLDSAILHVSKFIPYKRRK